MSANRTHKITKHPKKAPQNIRFPLLSRLSSHLVNGDSVHVCIIHKPNNLIGEQLSVVLRGQVRLCRFTGIQLQCLSDALPQHIEGWVGLHNLSHGLLDQRLHSRDPVTTSTKRVTWLVMSSGSSYKMPCLPVQVVGKVKCDHQARWGGIDAHVVRRVVKKLGTCVTFNVM